MSKKEAQISLLDCLKVLRKGLPPNCEGASDEASKYHCEAQKTDGPSFFL